MSTDKQFAAKAADIVGLYLSPPERAVVLCVDEKSQVQALDRTQPLLPMRPGQVDDADDDAGADVDAGDSIDLRAA